MSQPQLSQILDQIMLQEGIEYAVFDEQRKLVTASAGLGQLLFHPSTDDLTGRPLHKIFPELVGSENFLQEAAHQTMPSLRLDFVHRTHADGEVYLTISAHPFVLGDQQHVLVSIRQATHEGRMNQRLMQQRNELHMLASSLNRMRARITPLLNKYVPAEALMQSTDLLNQEETIIPRLFEIIRHKNQLAYLILTPELQIAFTSSLSFPFIHYEPQDIQGLPVSAVFPELIGMEDVLHEILEGKQKQLRLENINFNQPGESTAYLTFSVWPLDPGQPDLGLVFLIEDVTAASRQRQQAVQDRNLLRLLHIELEKARRQTETALAEAHTEIQERERVETALRTSQELLNLAMEIARMAVWELDLQGRTINLSDSFFTLLGVRPASPGDSSIPVDQFLARYIHPEDRRGLEANMTAFIESSEKGRKGEYQLRYFAADRELRYAQVEYQLKNQAGPTDAAEKQFAFGYFMDITASKQTQAALDQRTHDLQMAVEELEAFSYTVSHDLRAPLRALRGYSQAVLEQYSEALDEDGRSMVHSIDRAAQRMDRLIEDLLRLAYENRRVVSKTQVEPGALVERALQELGATYPLSKYQITIAEFPPCEADPALLYQVFINLISNALKFSSKCEAPAIRVGWLNQKHRTVYYVHDNGVGFDMAQADKLFGVFARLHSYAEYEGSGIGLAIVNRIIQRHGGSIWFTAAENQGATFYFTLESDTNT